MVLASVGLLGRLRIDCWGFKGLAEIAQALNIGLDFFSQTVQPSSLVLRSGAVAITATVIAIAVTDSTIWCSQELFGLAVYLTVLYL